MKILNIVLLIGWLIIGIATIASANVSVFSYAAGWIVLIAHYVRDIIQEW